MSVLEGNDIQENWATDFGGMVGGGNEAGEAEDVLSATGNRGGSSSIMSAPGGQQWQLSKPLPPLLPYHASRVSLVREVMAKM
jgi:hypothetical protein